MYRLPLRPILVFSDPALEQRFKIYYTNCYYRYAQTSLAMGFFFLICDFFADGIAFPGHHANSYRLFLCAPILGLGLMVSFAPSVRRNWQLAMSAMLIAFGLSIFLVLFDIDRQGGMGLTSWVGIIDFATFELFCFVILGLGFSFALPAGLLLLLAFESAMLLALHEDLRRFFYLSYHVFSIFMCPVIIGWWRELFLRRDFATKSDLEAARHAAEALSRVKSDFLANMSHEIRTPMNAIIGMSRLALQANLDPKKQRSYVEKVNLSAQHLLGLINQVLDFSKGEAGALSMEEESFSLDDVMANLSNLITVKAADQGLDFLFDLSPDLPGALIGDALRLGQVLVNLAGNAAKFTARGEVVVGVTQASRTADRVELHFWVKDSGIGMTLAQQSRLFESYSQADSSITREYGGTGLGLAISKQLVELMGGTISVQSELGKGTCVQFTLPFRLPAQPVSHRPPRRDELSGKRVLVVDDNEAAREILVAMVQGFGMRADSAWDGTQALAAIEAGDQHGQPFDLVLIDWRMPHMDGLECARLVQVAGYSKAPAIIMVTADSNWDEAVTAAAGQNVIFKSVLAKPICPSTLLDALHEAIGGRNSKACPPAHVAARETAAMRKLRGARLLLVEDNALNQELAVEVLAQAGILSLVANNGREALDILALDRRFDGILMDCNMPVMDGLTATRQIRQDPDLAAMPIIAMTANAMAGDRDKVLAAGMSDHISKPFDVNEMFETLARWINPANLGHLGHRAALGLAVDEIAAPLVPELPGIDTKAGLARTMHNQKLYLKLLRQFYESEADFAGAFRRARQDDDILAPERLAHTLRGAAGSIGAGDVEAAATALEQACATAEAAEAIENAFEKTLLALRPVIEGLAPLIASKMASAPKHVTAKEMIRPLLTRLIALLEDNNLEAQDAVEDLAVCVEHTALAGRVGQAVQAVAIFDIELALEILTKLEGEMEPELAPN
jgi:signal transduction histidine kinase/CheY-like chemotaxis protein/HPt (histidine-containing phosphotransfer) domain-containing protein